VVSLGYGYLRFLPNIHVLEGDHPKERYSMERNNYCFFVVLLVLGSWYHLQHQVDEA